MDQYHSNTIHLSHSHETQSNVFTKWRILREIELPPSMGFKNSLHHGHLPLVLFLYGMVSGRHRSARVSADANGHIWIHRLGSSGLADTYKFWILSGYVLRVVGLSTYRKCRSLVMGSIYAYSSLRQVQYLDVYRIRCL